MSYNSERAMTGQPRYVLTFDCETVADLSVVPMLKPVSAPGHYKKPDAINAYIAEAEAERVNKLALDPDGCQLAALAWTDLGGTVRAFPISDEKAEASVLRAFWHEWGVADLRCGFNVVSFDLPVLIQRSRILGVAPQHVTLKKFGADGVVDLMLDLHFGGITTYKGQDFWLKRLGLTTATENPCKGSDIGALYAAGDWDTIVQHVTADVEGAVLLAQRLGVR